MKVGLIQIDGKWQNLALLKLATWHKKKGDEVFYVDLSSFDIDVWYASKVFVGGSGYDINSKLPDEIEHCQPDYDLFKNTYSIGFTSRGCIRNCEFCIVRPKEGYITEWADFSEFLKHDKALLLDNNFLASPKWKEKLEFLISNKIKVCFTQGLDIRLINDEKAKLLAKIDYRDNKFKKKRLYFAFDDPKLEKIVKKGIEILIKYGVKPNHLLFYVLVNHNTTFEEDYQRFEVLNKLGCLPFIMIYEKWRAPKKIKDFARWINKRYYKMVPWKEYNAQKR